MKKFYLLLAAVLFSVSLHAQSVIETSINSFSRIRVSGNIAITVTRGDSLKIKAELQNIASDRFEWNVRDNELSIKLKQPFNSPKGSAIVAVSYDMLESIVVDGGATFLSNGAIRSDLLSLDASSRSVVSIEAETRDLSLVAGNSSVTVKGYVEYLTIKANANASVNTVTMECQNATVTTASNAECYVSAEKRLEGRATTNSTIYYKGAPEIVKTSTSTLGSIESF